MIRPVRFLSTGSALPAARLASEEIDRRMARRPGFTAGMTGVESRAVAQTEDQIDLAVAAARRALDESGLEPEAVGLLLFAAAVPYQSIPATAPLVQQRLGLGGGSVAAFDINATCLGFLSAADLAASMIAAGQCRAALVVSAEIASRALPWDTAPLTAALFGDGAAAAVIAASDGRAHVAAALTETYPEGYDHCRLGAGGTRYDFRADPEAFRANSLFEMDGKALYRLTFQHFEPFLHRLLDRAGWRLDEVDLVLPHQASALALDHLVQKCGFSRDIVIDIIRDHGNQVAASLPTVLDHARRTGRLVPGTRALMIGTSAGLSLGGMDFVA